MFSILCADSHFQTSTAAEPVERIALPAACGVRQMPVSMPCFHVYLPPSDAADRLPLCQRTARHAALTHLFRRAWRRIWMKRGTRWSAVPAMTASDSASCVAPGSNLFILSTEKIPVASRRGEKLHAPVLRGVTDKFSALMELGGRDVIFCKASERPAVDAHSRRWPYGPLMASSLQKPARPIIPPPGRKGSQAALPR